MKNSNKLQDTFNKLITKTVTNFFYIWKQVNFFKWNTYNDKPQILYGILKQINSSKSQLLLVAKKFLYAF